MHPRVIRIAIGARLGPRLAIAVNPFGHGASDGHGEVAVDVEMLTHDVGAEGGFGGAEVVAQALHRLQIAGGGGQKAFVGVEMGLVVPVEAGKAESGSQDEDEKQQNDGDGFPGEGTAVCGWGGRLVIDGHK